ncbi:MAG: phosphatase PAP2 family protein [Patescibacteria group bacterium]|nr:phosphatase PAP2 family protein [Patescibacteria group bacterium]
MNLDYQIFKIINDLAERNPILDYLGIFNAKYLIWVFAILLIVLVLFYKNKQKHRIILRVLICCLMSIISVLAINYLTSLFYFRPRPFVDHGVNLLIQINNLSKSLPSNHTAIAMTVAFCLYFFNKKNRLYFNFSSGFDWFSQNFCWCTLSLRYNYGWSNWLVGSFIEL